MENGNKLRLLYIYQHLFRYSDAEHPVTTPELLRYLKEEHGFDPGEKFLVAVLSIGKPAPGARSPKKKPLEEILTVIS